MEETKSILKKCPRCKQPMGCSAPKKGCWCESVTLTSKAYEYTAIHFPNECVCSNCIEELNKKYPQESFEQP